MRSSNIPTTGFIAMSYLSHLPETQVNRTNKQNIPIVKNRSFMRNKGHVFGIRTFTDSKNTMLGTCLEI